MSLYIRCLVDCSDTPTTVTHRSTPNWLLIFFCAAASPAEKKLCSSGPAPALNQPLRVGIPLLVRFAVFLWIAKRVLQLPRGVVRMAVIVI